jgi:Cu+-exporting ATPase
VFDVIRRHGLQGFYACDVTPGVSQRSRSGRDTVSLAALDDPATAAKFLEQRAGDESRAVFLVPALHCASCLWLIERLWKLDPAIQRAEVDLVHRTVRVTYRHDRISVRRVAECLAAVGYPPSLDADAIRPGVPKERRRLYLKIGVAGFAFGNAMLFSVPRYLNGAPLDPAYQTVFGALNLALAVLVLLFSAREYFVRAARALRYATVTLDVPVAIGLAALFFQTAFDIVLSRGEGYADSFTGLVFFLLIGRLFQQQAFERIAFDRTFRSFLPLAVRVVSQDTGRDVAVPVEHLRPGDRVVIRAGEIIPADARSEAEAGSVDLSFVTGEDRPMDVRRGEVVPAGARVVGVALQLVLVTDVVHGRLASLWSQSRTSDIPDALADVSRQFGWWFTVVAIGLAAAGFVAWWPDVTTSARVATAVLIVACPCALTLSAPLALGTAMTRLGERGVYLKGPGVGLQLSRVDTVVFDKTGTLTSKVNASGPARAMGRDAWRLVERLAAQSIHPISRAIVAAAATDSTGSSTDRPMHDAAAQRGASRSSRGPTTVEDCREVPGGGIAGRVDGHDVAIGARHFVAELATGVPRDPGPGPAVAIDGRFAGWLPVRFEPRPGLDESTLALSASYRTIVLSGDEPGDFSHFAAAFGDRVWFRQSPEDKLARVHALQKSGHRVLMVGDGLNDASALGAADVGMAVSDDTACVVPACDVVIAGNRLRDLPAILWLTRRTRQVIVACFVVSIFYNVIGLSLALFGALTPLSAAVLMPVSSLTIVGLSVGLTRWFAHRVPA